MIQYFPPGGRGKPKGTPLSSLPDGENASTVWIPEGEDLVEFLVLEHGYNEGASLLMRQDIHSLSAWGDHGSTYADSIIDRFLTQDYFDSLRVEVRGLLSDVYILSIPSVSGGSAVEISRKVFLLSYTEFNVTSDSYYEGNGINYFTNGSGADPNRTSKYQGTESNYYTRTSLNTSNALYINSSGATGNISKATNLGVRPAFCLPSDTLVDEYGVVITQ